MLSILGPNACLLGPSGHPSPLVVDSAEKSSTQVTTACAHVTADGQGFPMTPATAEEDRSPPRSENQGFRRNYFTFFGNPLTPNSSKFEISPKFCEAFFNPVKFRQIFIKICSKTSEIESKFAKNDEI